MNSSDTKIYSRALKIFSVFCALFLVFAFVPTVFAASLTSISDTMSRVKASTASDHTIRFTTPTGVDAPTDTITIAFPAGFTVGSVDYTDIDFSHGASTGAETEETLAAAAASGTWGAVFAGTTLTLTPPTNATTGEVTASDKVIIEIGNHATGGNAQLTNPTAGTQVVTIAGNFGDSGKFAVAVIADDQFTVNASVDPTITFAIDTTGVTFGTLTSSSVATATSVQTSNAFVRMTISTNGQAGYTITVRDQGNGTNPGMYNSTANYMIGSSDYSYNNSVDLTSNAGYGLQATSGTATVAAPYNVSGNNVGGFERTAQSLASYNGMADTQTVDMSLKAKVSGLTPAGAYSDTVTVIATANF